MMVAYYQIVQKDLAQIRDFFVLCYLIPVLAMCQGNKDSNNQHIFGITLRKERPL